MQMKHGTPMPVAARADALVPPIARRRSWVLRWSALAHRYIPELEAVERPGGKSSGRRNSHHQKRSRPEEAGGERHVCSGDVTRASVADRQ